MARKNVLVHQLEASKSLAASFTTDPTVILYGDNIAYQINVTTSNSEGSFSVQASLDYVPADNPINSKPANMGNWIDLTLAGGVPIVAAANDQIIIDLNQLPFVAVRLKYNSSTAGTGTCDVYIASKQLGG